MIPKHLFGQTGHQSRRLPKAQDAASRFEVEPADEVMPGRAARLGLEPLLTAERAGS